MLKDFLNKKNIIAVAGASRDKDKYGYKLYKAILHAGYEVYPVNPNTKEIDGNPCYPSLVSVPKKPDVVITVVPPEITEKIVEEAKELGIKKVWMQPGSESEKAIEFCNRNKIEVVARMCFVADGLKEDLEKLAFDL